VRTKGEKIPNWNLYTINQILKVFRKPLNGRVIYDGLRERYFERYLYVINKLTEKCPRGRPLKRWHK